MAQQAYNELLREACAIGVCVCVRMGAFVCLYVGAFFCDTA